MIQIEREKLEKVLEALEDHDSWHGDKTQQAITIIKDVLAQPDQFRDATKMMAQKDSEPVAWLSTDSIGERYLCFDKPLDNDPVQPLYTKEQL